jgi:hypothetical protein
MPPIAQYLFNGLVTGGILALPAVAFSVHEILALGAADA